ncbi:acetyl-CoA carboxylase biotin carboxyl carrier protein subunit [Muricauda sp. JGD-17]|uniref:Acetyl-CoA carboxylase biotin carboxyl carrier protein subunit n=1 Tax=Flagellimonas ochracea TaxID=2696472 RepID=A0A964T936_9FLAO|nr:acetyl-CoA carboxylase biotin carboxyl carrier protein subunit [Allomuricauda ochracea]NAY90497.1 acetyl-CoA carboxylase biotin carboxyl carrier protein subunit [Allomuricauda ochracea]
MEKSYKIQIDHNLDFQLTEKDVSALDLIRTGSADFHLLKDGISYHLKVLKTDFSSRNYTVSVNGNEHNVSINDPLDELIEKMGFAVNGSKNIDSITAPMPGLILDIIVEVGTEVKEEDQLLILEAMKMENIITSPRNGIIKSIAVKQGEAVDKKQLLIEFE